MNEKEISEIRRRFKADKCNISRIRGCYVSEKKEIISEFNQSFALIPQEESEELLAILKKTLSGSLGKNLLDIEFSTQQVVDSDEHRLLMSLKNSVLEDDAAVSRLYEKIINSVAFEGSYLILLSCDKYDVFSYSKDGGREEDSSTVFSYFLCSVCPVKLTKPALSYYASDRSFHNLSVNAYIGSPELGFMFPSFDDRAANIYNTLYYTRDAANMHDAFIGAVFNSDVPMPAETQKETFQNILSSSVSESCNYEVVQTVHDRLNEMIVEHKANKEEEPLMISKKTVSSVLHSCGVDDDRVTAFEDGYDARFGADTQIRPQNIMDTKQIQVRTADVTIKVNPDRSDLITTQIIDGTKYILIRAEENVEVNGVNIHIS